MTSSRSAALSNGVLGILLATVSVACAPAAPPAEPAPVATTSDVVGTAPKNAIVTLLPASGPPPVPEQPAVMDQLSKQFIPSVLVARPGQPVEFRNSEDMPHNVAVTRRGSGTEVFNVSTESGQKYVHTFDRVGQFDVLCDIHEGMSAVVIVAPGPTTIIAGNDGQFAFPAVPFGSYKLSMNFEGQTVEQALEVNQPKTVFKLDR